VRTIVHQRLGSPHFPLCKFGTYGMMLRCRRRSASVKRIQALLKHAVLLLDHVHLTAVDPPGEYHEQQPQRLKWWGHCSVVYRLINHSASSSGRLAHSPIASLQLLDTTGHTVGRSRRLRSWLLPSGALGVALFEKPSARRLRMSGESMTATEST
jgi:hypothetical protein